MQQPANPHVRLSLHTTVHPYATLAYANTLRHVGRPIHVRSWRTHVIARDWNDVALDATGTYPIAWLAPESDLGSGLAELRDAGMVSVTLVVDNLLGPPMRRLEEAFSFARPFKTHYLVDWGVAVYQPSQHHRHEVRRAARRGVDVRIVRLRDILDQWTALYDELISRHRIQGVQRFSRESFEALTHCEGLCTVAAFIRDELVSCHLWVRYGGFVWSHLAATSALGYANSAAYAVYDQSIVNFSGHVIDLGGAAGTDDTATDGLARLKAGFSNRRNAAYLCGAVLDASRYEELCVGRGVSAGDYFPAYRAPTTPA